MVTATDSRSAGEPGRERDKRRRILAAAQEVFAEQGFDAARMEEVARRARVGKGTLYNYCESKVDLLIHAVIASMEEVRERIAATVDPSRLPGADAGIAAHSCRGRAAPAPPRAR